MHSLLTPRRAEAWRAAQPVPSLAELETLMAARREARQVRYSRAYRWSIIALRLVAILVVLLLLALAFLLFGEERSERPQPELTPAQRAAAYRMPTP